MNCVNFPAEGDSVFYRLMCALTSKIPLSCFNEALNCCLVAHGKVVRKLPAWGDSSSGGTLVTSRPNWSVGPLRELSRTFVQHSQFFLSRAIKSLFPFFDTNSPQTSRCGRNSTKTVRCELLFQKFKFQRKFADLGRTSKMWNDDLTRQVQF